MEAEIKAVQRLGGDLKQSIFRLTRKIQLFEINALRETKTSLEAEESGLLLELKKLKEIEAVHKREAATIRDVLAAKSADFSEMTISATEHLKKMALQRENAILEARIRGLKEQTDALRSQTSGFPEIDDTTIASQLAKAGDLRRKHGEALARQQRVEALVELTLEAAAATAPSAAGTQSLWTEDACTAQLEAAVEQMSRMLAERKAAMRGAPASAPKDNESCQSRIRLERLSTLLSVERDREQAQLRILGDSLTERIQRNRQLAESDCYSGRPGGSDQPEGCSDDDGHKETDGPSGSILVSPDGGGGDQPKGCDDSASKGSGPTGSILVSPDGGGGDQPKGCDDSASKGSGPTA